MELVPDTIPEVIKEFAKQNNMTDEQANAHLHDVGKERQKAELKQKISETQRLLNNPVIPEPEKEYKYFKTGKVNLITGTVKGGVTLGTFLQEFYEFTKDKKIPFTTTDNMTLFFGPGVFILLPKVIDVFGKSEMTNMVEFNGFEIKIQRGR
jgi:hypothetical protein